MRGTSIEYLRDICTFLLSNWKTILTETSNVKSDINFKTSNGFNYKQKCFQNLIFMLFQWSFSKYLRAQLSKITSDLKQKCTLLLTSFLGTVFHALSHDVIHFVPCVSSKNFEMEVSDWQLKNFNQWKSGFSTKMNHTKWKSMKNCAQKWCRKLCAFLFEVIMILERCEMKNKVTGFKIAGQSIITLIDMAQIEQIRLRSGGKWLKVNIPFYAS